MKSGYEYRFTDIREWSDEKLLQAYARITETLVERQIQQGWPVLQWEQFAMVHSLPDCRVVTVDTGKTVGSGWGDIDGEVAASLLVLRCQTHGVDSKPYQHVWMLNSANYILARFPITR